MTYDTSGIQQEGGQGYFGQEESVWEAQYRKGERGKKGIARSPINCPCCGKSFVIGPGKSLKTRFCSKKCGSSSRPKEVIANEKKKCMTCHALVGMTGAASGRMLKLSRGQIAVFRNKNKLPVFSRSQAGVIAGVRAGVRGGYLLVNESGRIESMALDKTKDPSLKLARRLRAALHYWVKRNGTITREVIGCTQNHLRLHLESKFKKWMNWDNYGSKWHVDHIIPVSLFNHSKPDQIRQCWHWTNLEPLGARENLAKGSRVIKPQMSLMI